MPRAAATDDRLNGDPAGNSVTCEARNRISESGKHFSAPSKIRFASQEKLTGSIQAPSPEVNHWRRDWQSADFTPQSREVIALGQLKYD